MVELFLQSIKDKSPQSQVSVLMTDDGKNVHIGCMGIIDNSTLILAVDCNQVFSTYLLRIRVCRNFAKGGANLGNLKRGGRSCKQRQGEHWKTMLKN